MQESVPVLIGGVPLDAFLAFIFAFIASLFLGNLAYMLLRRLLDGRASRGKVKWAAAILQYSITVGGVYASARYFLDFELTAFFASLGILGIAVAFSSRQIIQNAVAGVLITINRPVQLEEWVVVSGRPETGLCRVQDISFTTTILQALDGGLVSRRTQATRPKVIATPVPVCLRSCPASPGHHPRTGAGSPPRRAVILILPTSSWSNGPPSRTSSISTSRLHLTFARPPAL